MIALRPRCFVNRGSVLASGFMIPWDIAGINEARRRVLALWHPGLQLKKTESAFVMLLPTTVRVIAEQAIGDPLVRHERVLVALPLQPKEVECLSLPSDSIVFAKAGRIQTLPLTALTDEDMSQWIDTESAVIADVISLGAPPVKPVFHAPEFDSRKMPGVPPASSELKRLLAELRQSRQQEGAARTGSRARPSRMKVLAAFKHLFQRLRGLSLRRKPRLRGQTQGGIRLSAAFRRLIQYVRGLSFRRKPEIQTPARAPEYRAAEVPGRMSLSAAFRWLFQFVRELSFRRKQGIQTGESVPEYRAAEAPRENPFWNWLTRSSNWLLDFNRFSQLLSLRHARYLSRLVTMMRSGDIEEGLRHAIPLANARDFAPKRRSWWFGLPKRRADLSIKPYRPPAQSGWDWGVQVYDYLRNLYRQAFQRLEAQGRVEEAAFVLAELLASHAEAVSFLEKHGKFALAAEIAEAKNLSPAMAIRLWWLAKEYKRAIALARRTGEYELAIKHLSANHPEEADKLRVLWAQRLALSGKYVAAAEAIWPMRNSQRLVSRWYTQAIELGGTAGGIALARKAARFPESFPEVLLQAESLLADETAESARGRYAFVESLRQERRTPESQVLARVATRSVVRDLQQGAAEFTPAQLRDLLDYTGDPCLRADVPAVQALKPELEKAATIAVVEIAADDVGLHAVTDVALLPDGRLLLALGETGILFLSREGKPIAHLNQPVHKLIVSDEASRAIGIALRDSVSRLVRIDVLARTASYWCDATISAYTDSFDGSVWCVADGQDVFLIDTLARRFEPLWRIPDLDGRVRAMQRNRKELNLFVVTENEKQLTRWMFAQPSCTLRSKEVFTADPSQELNAVPGSMIMRAAMAISEVGDIYERLAYLPAGQDDWQSLIYQLKTTPSGGSRQLLAANMVAGGLASATFHDPWMAVPVRKENDIEIFLADSHSGEGKLRIRLRGAKEISLRFAETVLLCADNQGRVLGLDVRTNKMTRDLRI